MCMTASLALARRSQLLYYTARLRLPASCSKAFIEQRVRLNHILSVLYRIRFAGALLTLHTLQRQMPARLHTHLGHE
jgi:hypothetical protein